MFAILLSDKMDPFYQNIASFPTAFFTFFLALSMLYWCIAVLGFVDIDAFDLDGVEADIDINSDAGTTSGDALVGLIHRLGLNGIPLTVVITFLSLLGWVISYFIVDIFFGWVPDGIVRWVVSVPVILGSLYVAAVLTAIAVKPLRPFFAKMEQQTSKLVLGQTAVVRTLRVDSGFGEATLEDGGAGLIFKVRAIGDAKFKQGDRVVLLEHIKENNTFTIISEDEFLK